MDLSTRYLNLDLAHPLVLGASPVADDLDQVKRAEDAGVAAIVMRSLFEEQLVFDDRALYHRRIDFAFDPDDYLERLHRTKQAVGVPVMGSLNVATGQGWFSHAQLIEQTGADALELNLYRVGVNPDEPAQAVEDGLIDIVRNVRSAIKIPLAVKLSPFFTSVPHFARRLDAAGIDGLVMFNRLYQPEMATDGTEVPHLQLSHPSELLLRLVHVAALSGRVAASLAVTGGIHNGVHAIKAMIAGAHAVQVVSAILLRGPEYFRVLRGEMLHWLEEHEYDSLAQIQGSMGGSSLADPAAHERAGYVNVLQSWRRPLRPSRPGV